MYTDDLAKRCHHRLQKDPTHKCTFQSLLNTFRVFTMYGVPCQCCRQEKHQGHPTAKQPGTCLHQQVQSGISATMLLAAVPETPKMCMLHGGACLMGIRIVGKHSGLVKREICHSNTPHTKLLELTTKYKRIRLPLLGDPLPLVSLSLPFLPPLQYTNSAPPPPPPEYTNSAFYGAPTWIAGRHRAKAAPSAHFPQERNPL